MADDRREMAGDRQLMADGKWQGGQIPANGLRAAVFLDRDGTLIEDVPYLSDPARVRLLPGVADALRRLRCAGFVCIVVTNQSAVGRGWTTHERVEEVHNELLRQLAEHEVTLDAIYYCPAASD